MAELCGKNSRIISRLGFTFMFFMVKDLLFMIKAMDKWLSGYLGSISRNKTKVTGRKHLMFCIADHFEPFREDVEQSLALSRVRHWLDKYESTFNAYRDSDGRNPRHTFFYPAEEYDESCISLLKDFCIKGNGEVEIHLHHRNDTPENLAETIETYKIKLKKHGFLGTDRNGKTRYGFIHGNWALCNSRPDGDWCGVNNEIAVLVRTGCYADFTFPSAPSPTQPRLVNAIYYAKDNNGKPRGADSGRIVERGMKEEPDELLMVTGPLALNWSRRKYGILPGIENSGITAVNPPSAQRIDLWVDQNICISGRPDWIFVKIYIHGLVPDDTEMMFGPSMRELYEYLGDKYNDDVDWQSHYVSAREMYNIIKAAQDGKQGNPGDYRDYEIRAPF